MKGGIEFRQLSNVHEKILSLQQTKVRPSILMIFPSCVLQKNFVTIIILITK